MAAVNKLRFKVIYATSEDPDYPASQLNTVNPTTKGWQSVRFCNFPQELLFEMIDGDVLITQIQVLSHQFKISSKIEIFIGSGINPSTATFKRLGYLSLDSNERSDYQARELKTVYINKSGQYLKLVLNDNHPNKHNIYNQVGIIAVSLIGADISEAKATPRSIDAPKKVAGKNPYTDITVDMNLDPKTANKLRQLADAKSRAIQNEDYLTAKQIKQVELELKAMGSKLAQLDLAKSEAVESEEYDLAKEIKDQSDNLRMQIEQKIRTIEIPGVKLNTPSKTPKFAPSKNSQDDDYGGNHLNVDDIAVGPGAGGYGNYSSEGAPTRKPVKVEAYDNPAYHDPIGHQPILNEPSIDESNLDVMERPIRPKVIPSEFYDDSAPPGAAGNDDGGAGGIGGTGMPVERFAPGDHPLEGVSNFLDLPTPEQLNTLNREFCETNGITRLIGEYRARCLYCKVWAVREAVITKIQQLLAQEFANGDMNSSISALGAILKIGMEDKIQQVFFNTITLLEQVLKVCKSARLPRSSVTTALDHVLTQCVEKLADGNARLREGGRKALDVMAASAVVGPSAVQYHLVKALPAKQKTAWRPIAARLQVLTDLVTLYGLNNSSGLHMDTMLNFSKTTGSYAHSNGEVREAAKLLVVAIEKQVGREPLEPTLSLLRKNQREEYEAAFEGNGGNNAPPVGGTSAKKAPSSAGGGGGNREHKNSSPPRRTDMSHQHATHNPGGKVPTSAARVQDQRDGYDNKNDHEQQDQPAQEFTSCMFCGVHNPSWTENDLDLHYWKDCPLLIACPSCSQIVEIAGLPEHLLDECDAKGSYEPCEVTGLAIKREDFNKWSNSPQCVPAPENYMYCPLCFATVEDSDQAWLQHLTRKCSKNVRITGRS